MIFSIMKLTIPTDPSLPRELHEALELKTLDADEVNNALTPRAKFELFWTNPSGHEHSLKYTNKVKSSRQRWTTHSARTANQIQAGKMGFSRACLEDIQRWNTSPPLGSMAQLTAYHLLDTAGAVMMQGGWKHLSNHPFNVP